MHSPAWEHSALFITYDEHGGYYDHVPPPRAIKPDSTPPRLKPDDPPGAYDRYGFRVPLIAVSPYARANYVSRVVQDHTSILRFIEGNWNIGAMTFRDANAADMTDYFDFRRPAFRQPAAPGRRAADQPRLGDLSGAWAEPSGACRGGRLCGRRCEPQGRAAAVLTAAIAAGVKLSKLLPRRTSSVLRRTGVTRAGNRDR